MTSLMSPVYRGTVKASGLFIPAIEGVSSSITRIVFDHWHLGVSLHQIELGFILVFKEPLIVLCRQSEGYPLVSQRIGLSTAPLTDSIVDAMTLDSSSVICVQGNEFKQYQLSPVTKVDLSSWVAIGEFELVTTKHLGCKLPSPVLEIDAPERQGRSIFGESTYGSTDDSRKALEALKQGAAKYQKTGKGNPFATSAVVSQLARSVLSIVAVTTLLVMLVFGVMTSIPPLIVILGLILLAGLGAALAPANKAVSASSDGKARASASNEPTQYKSNRKSWMKRVMSQWFMMSQLGKILGRRQANYLKKVIEMFDEGKFEDALRHAIPLSSARELFEEPEGYAMGAPGPRKDLSINHQRGRTNAIGVGDDFQELLREKYRRAFEKLNKEKRFKDAAFVLTELLAQEEEAVTYLERNDEKELAAELAEGRQLDPGLVVRQWIVAGNIDRAVLIARQTNAYEKAIFLLESHHSEEAQNLREMWALSLADAGDYLQAVDVIWPIDDKRPLALNWIEIGIGWGGEAAARLLPKKLTLLPESFDDVIPLIHAITNGAEIHSTNERLAMIEEVIELKPTPAINAVASLVLRGYMRDVATGCVVWHKDRFQRLATAAGDNVIKEDIKSLNMSSCGIGESLKNVREPIEIFSELAGMNEIHDINMLPGGRFLIAHGEAGVSVRRPDGSVQKAFNVPAIRISLSDHYNRCITIATRGDLCRLSRINLESGKIDDWTEADIQCLTESNDGDTWLVGNKDRVYALDLHANELKAVWQVSELPGQVVCMSRSPTSLALIVQGESQCEYWRYKLPSLTLKERTPFEKQTIAQFDFCDITHDGLVFFLNKNEDNDKLCLGIISQYKPPQKKEIEVGGMEPISIKLLGQWVVVKLIDTSHQHLWLWDVSDGRVGNVRLKITLRSESNIHYKLSSNTLLVNSVSGGILMIDLLTGGVVKQLSL